MDEASFDSYQASDHTASGQGAVDIGGLVETGAGTGTGCKIAQHFILRFFSYVTVESAMDNEEFIKWPSEIWKHELLNTDVLDMGDKV
jgi:hypothetical protein